MGKKLFGTTCEMCNRNYCGRDLNRTCIGWLNPNKWSDDHMETIVEVNV